MIAVARLDPVLHPRRPHALVLSVTLHLCLMAAWILAPSPAPHDLGAGTLQVQLVTEPPPPEPPPPEPQPEPVKPQVQPQPQPVTKPAPAKVAPKPVAAKPAPVLTAQAETATSQEMAPAAEAPPAAPVAAPAPTAPAGVPESQSAARDEYMSVVWARIMRHRPPRVPLAGTAKLRFAVAADGELLSAEIAESSGSGLLDRAALDAVRRAAPFPPPPSSGGAVQHFVIPFQFRPTG